MNYTLTPDLARAILERSWLPEEWLNENEEQCARDDLNAREIRKKDSAFLPLFNALFRTRHVDVAAFHEVTDKNFIFVSTFDLFDLIKHVPEVDFEEFRDACSEGWDDITEPFMMKFETSMNEAGLTLKNITGKLTDFVAFDKDAVEKLAGTSLDNIYRTIFEIDIDTPEIH